MKNQRAITTMKLFDSVVVAAGTDEDSVPIDLREIAQSGFFSLYYDVSGTGTIQLEYQACAEKAGTYVTPTGATAIAATLAGQGMVSFAPMLAPFMRIKATEDGGAADATLSLWINIQ